MNSDDKKKATEYEEVNKTKPPTKRFSAPYAGTWFWGVKTVADFKKEITETTAILGRQSAVKVVFSGNSVSTNPKKKEVTLPDFEDSLELDRGAISFMRGIVDHESGHLRFTDGNKYYPALDKGHKDNKKLLSSLIEVVEDLRVDRAYASVYGGSKKNLEVRSEVEILSAMDQIRQLRDRAETWSKLSEEEIKKAKNLGMSIPKKPTFAEMVGLALLGKYKRENMGMYCFDFKEFYDKEYSEKEKELIEDWVKKIHDCDNTEDSIKLANKIYDYFQKIDESEENQGGEGEDNRSQGSFKNNPLTGQYTPRS